MNARPRPTPADYAVADQCMAELAKTVDADWHQRHHDDNREHFAMAAMQKRLNSIRDVERIAGQSIRREAA